MIELDYFFVTSILLVGVICQYERKYVLGVPIDVRTYGGGNRTQQFQGIRNQILV